jgi:DNA-binding Lrp family transcriptional regulator
MQPCPDPLDRALLDRFQRDLPVVPHPFRAIGRALGLAEAEVIARLVRLSAIGAISRVGGTTRPNTVGASTLAAIAVPDDRIDEVAATVGAEEGVNHSYLRENRWNLWFVATGPDRAHVEGALARLRRRTGLAVLDLPLVRPFNVDLGFALDGGSLPPPVREADPAALEPADRPILQALSDGLALVPRPYAALAAALGRDEAAVLARVRALLAAGLIGRLGVIVRHRALGWTANAMVVWQIPEAAIPAAGQRLVGVPGVTLCYQRRPAGAAWPYALYCMIHARTRPEALGILVRAEAAADLAGLPKAVLFSVRCFKQRGALVLPKGAAA